MPTDVPDVNSRDRFSGVTPVREFDLVADVGVDTANDAVGGWRGVATASGDVIFRAGDGDCTADCFGDGVNTEGEGECPDDSDDGRRDDDEEEEVVQGDDDDVPCVDDDAARDGAWTTTRGDGCVGDVSSLPAKGATVTRTDMYDECRRRCCRGTTSAETTAAGKGRETEGAAPMPSTSFDCCRDARACDHTNDAFNGSALAAASLSTIVGAARRSSPLLCRRSSRLLLPLTPEPDSSREPNNRPSTSSASPLSETGEAWGSLSAAAPTADAAELAIATGRDVNDAIRV